MELVDGIKQWLRGDLQEMGQFQYSAHAGSWDGVATSGDLQWQQILANSVLYTMPAAEKRLLPRIAQDIGRYVLDGLPIVDLGTGGEHAMRDKLAPIANAAHSGRVVLVDSSPALLTQARNAMRELTGVSITRVMDDFLDDENTQYVDRPALVTYTGITIGNILADSLAEEPPRRELTDHIERVCAKSHGGHALITFDSMLDEKINKAAYEEHLLFHLNFLDQAVVEHGFPTEVRSKIVYRAAPRTWHDEKRKPLAGVIGHYAEFTEDVAFSFGGELFAIQAGVRLLMKHSFKYSLRFFKECAEEAGTTIIKTWRAGSHIGILLKSPPNLSFSPRRPIYASAVRSEPLLVAGRQT